MKRAVIIVAAGSGSRMGGKLPKQFLDLAGKPLIVHTLERFHSFDPGMKVVVVLAPDRRDLWEQKVHLPEVFFDIILADGGSSRFDSVRSGLKHMEDGILVGIHDAVRPFVSMLTLERCYAAAADKGSGIPVVEMEDSVRLLEQQGGSLAMDRSRLVRVQTPQVFKSELIKKAYQQAYKMAFTDDASVYESEYRQLSLVEGNSENIKITTPTDLKLASLLMGSVE